MPWLKQQKEPHHCYFPPSRPSNDFIKGDVWACGDCKKVWVWDPVLWEWDWRYSRRLTRKYKRRGAI